MNFMPMGNDSYGGFLTPEDRQQALMRSLSAFGSGVLSQGYTRLPQTPFQAIGAGLENARSAHDQALDRMVKLRLLGRQATREDASDARADTQLDLSKQNAERQGKLADAQLGKIGREEESDASMRAQAIALADQLAGGDQTKQGMLRAQAIGNAKGFLDQHAQSLFPPQQKPGEFQQKLMAMGLQPGTPAYQEAARRLAKQDGEGDGGGPFKGTGMDQQVHNILLRGDPASAEYAAAYQYAAQPKATFDPQTGSIVTTRPDLSAFRAPTNRAQQQPAQAPAGQSFDVSGANVTVTPAIKPKMTQADQTRLTQARAGATSIASALNDFVNTRKTSGTFDRVKSYVGASTPLNTSFNIAALLSKGQELFDLGVLNGPDLEIIRRAIPDPSTTSGAVASQADVEKSVGKIMDVLATRVNSLERSLGQELTPREKLFGGAAKLEDPLGIR